jgi:hypothetical protein
MKSQQIPQYSRTAEKNWVMKHLNWTYAVTLLIGVIILVYVGFIKNNVAGYVVYISIAIVGGFLVLWAKGRLNVLWVYIVLVLSNGFGFPIAVLCLNSHMSRKTIIKKLTGTLSPDEKSSLLEDLMEVLGEREKQELMQRLVGTLDETGKQELIKELMEDLTDRLHEGEKNDLNGLIGELDMDEGEEVIEELMEKLDQTAMKELMEYLDRK